MHKKYLLCVNESILLRLSARLASADCGAHKLNLAISGSLFKCDDIGVLLTKCRGLVGHFAHSNLAYERLRVEQEQKGRYLSLICPTLPELPWACFSKYTRPNLGLLVVS